MARTKGIGWGIVLSGLYMEIHCGVTGDAAGQWANLGLVVMFIGAMLILSSKLRTG